MVDLAATLDRLPPVFDRAAGLAAGLSSRTIRRAVERGLLTRATTGVYLQQRFWEAADRRDRHLLMVRAALIAHPGLTVSHHSAALLWQLPVPLALPGWVSLATGRRQPTATPDGLLRMEPGALPPRHVVEVGGGRRTTPPRTVVDCLRCLPFGDALAVADGAARRGLVTRTGLEEVRAHERGWPYVSQVDLALPVIDPRRENWFESFSVARLFQRGVPVPESQVEIYDAAGRFLGRIDAFWRDGATVGEADGQGKYLGDVDLTGPDARAAARRVVAEKVREDRIRDTGLQFVRWDATDILGDPQGVADRVHRARAQGDLARFTGRLVVRPIPHQAA